MPRTTPHAFLLALSVAVVASVAIAQPAPAPESPPEKPAFGGAAALFSVGAVTVVYPAGGDAGSARVARLSAEHRAAYLRYRGVEAAAVADDAVTPEVRSGNLLVLGWDNALLPAGAVTSAAGGGHLLLGEIPIGPSQDLMFVGRSPWGADRGLVFWSRIEPELDRQVPIPFLGSDWGVYSGFELIRQGMFQARKGWPPERDTLAERVWGDRLREMPAGPASEHYRLHSAPGSVDADAARAVLAAREQAYRRAVELVGDPGPDFRIELYVYPDRETKREISGIVDPVHSVPRSRELHMQIDSARSPHPHEEIHLVAGALWGPCRSSALYEGLALALAGVAGELDRTAALLRELGEVPPVAELLDEAGLLGWNERQLGLPSAGLLVRWMIDRKGPQAVGRVYGDLPPTPAGIAAAAGVAPSELQSTFEAWVRQRGAGATSDLQYRRALEAASRLSEQSDWAGAADALGKALEARPDEPEALYSLGLMELRAGRRADAERHLKRLVGLDVGPAAERYVIFGHYQLGQLLAPERPEEARAAYRRVLALPDRYGSHAMAEKALAELGAKGSDPPP